MFASVGTFSYKRLESFSLFWYNKKLITEVFFVVVAYSVFHVEYLHLSKYVNFVDSTWLIHTVIISEFLSNCIVWMCVREN